MFFRIVIVILLSCLIGCGGPVSRTLSSSTQRKFEKYTFFWKAIIYMKCVDSCESIHVNGDSLSAFSVDAFHWLKVKYKPKTANYEHYPQSFLQYDYHTIIYKCMHKFEKYPFFFWKAIIHVKSMQWWYFGYFHCRCFSLTLR